MNTSQVLKSDRTEWRVRCRIALANHIHDRLGLLIPPGDVRLIPKQDDKYRWNIKSSEVTYLFEKQISKHCLGAYRELYIGIGTCFEAVKAEDFDKHFPPNINEQNCDKILPTLESLQSSHDAWKNEAVSESARSGILEAELVQARATNEAIQKEIRVIREENLAKSKELLNASDIFTQLSTILQEKASRATNDVRQFNWIIRSLKSASDRHL